MSQIPAIDPDSLAARLLAVRAGGAPLDPREALVTSAAEAYEVQNRVVEKTGPVGGFKTARKPDQPVIMAPIFAADIHDSPAAFKPQRFGRVAIELELGFRILSPLPDPASPGFAQAARAHVALVPVFEIVETRLADLDGAPPLLRLADNQLNGGLVVGPELRDWSGVDTLRPRATLRLGDDTVLDGPADVPGGDAYETFCVLAGLIGTHCGGLQPGQIVITGSLNGMPFIKLGTEVRGQIDGLGEIAADFG